MTLYSESVAADLIGPIQHYLVDPSRPVRIKGDNIIVRTSLPAETPWYTTIFDEHRHCHLWHTFYFERYNVVHPLCMSCWKVMLPMQTIRELFSVIEVQRKLGCPSKVGLETRGRTGRIGKYLAAWYAPLDGGLAGGRKLYEDVAAALAADGLNPGKLILKRACTEFEQRFGPSDEWFKAEKQWTAMAKLLDSVYRVEGDPKEVSELARQRFKHVAIEFAFEHGDATYLDFTGGEPFYRPLVHYHDSKHVAEMMPSMMEEYGEPNYS